MATQVEHLKTERTRDSLERILSGATRTQVLTDAHAPVLIEQAIRREEGVTAANGALSVRTGGRTGRSPKDRFIVQDARTRQDIDWGPVNQSFSPEAFQRLWDRAVRHLESKDCIYVSHLQAGADSTHSIPLQIVTEYAWHALFARQLFVRPAHVNASNRDNWTVLSVPTFSTNPERDETAGDGAVILDLSNRRILVVGMRYAGEIKKAVFSAMNYLMPAEDILPMHCASNVGEDGDVALFFGLSGTGKTTLSADPSRFLIGDDEHGWNDRGIFNFEGGCYAKCINLSPEREPVIWDAIRFGAVMENVVINPDNRVPDYDDESMTQNSRVAYPRYHVRKRMPGNHAGHPQAVIFLTCDLFGVLPPVAILSKEQAAYHFLSGYTALVGSTEVGQIDEVKPTFSHCFGRPFFPRDPCVYAELLMDKVSRHNSRVYLVNTGWTGGAYGDGGRRFSIATTRAIVHAIVRGDLVHTRTRRLANLNLEIPTYIHGIDNRILNPKDTWYDKEAYDRTARHLIDLFIENFKHYEVDENIRAAGPRRD